MPNPLATAFVRVKMQVDPATARADVEAGLKSADLGRVGQSQGKTLADGITKGLKDSKLQVPVSADVAKAMTDIAALKAKIAELTKNKPQTPPVEVPTGKATVDVKALEARLADMAKRVSTFKVEDDDKVAVASLASMTVKLDNLSKKVASPKIDLQGENQALAGIAAVDLALDKLDKKTAKPKIDTSGLAGGVLGGIGPGIPGVSALAAGATALGGLGLAALPAAAAVGVAGGVAGAGAGVITTGAQTLIGKKNVAGQPATQGPLFDQAAAVTTAMQAAMKTAAAGMLDPLRQAFSQIPAMLKAITPALTSVFAGAGTMIAPLLNGLNQIAKTVLPLMAAAFRATAPLIAPVMSGLAALAAGVLPGLIAMLNAAKPAVQALSGILGTLGKDLGSAFTAMAPAIGASAVIFRALGDVLGALFPIIGNLAAVFATALAPVFSQFAGVIRALLPVLSIVGGVLAELAKAVLGDLISAFGAVATVLKTVGPALGVLAKSIGSVFTMLENTGVFAIFGDALEAIAVPLGNLIGLLIRQLAPLLPAVIGLISKLGGIFITVLAAGLAAVLTGITFLLQKMPFLVPVLAGAAAAWWLLNVAMSANPIGLVIIAIVALIGGIALLVTHWTAVWGAIKNVTAGVVGWFQSVFSPFFGGLARVFISGWDAVISFFAGFAAKIEAPFIAIKNFVTSSFDTWWKSNGDAIKAVWSALWSGILTTFHLFWDPLSVLIKAGWVVIQAVFTAGVAVVKAAWSAMWVVIQTAVTVAWAVIQALFKAGIAVVTAAWNLFWSVLGNVLKVIWAGIQAVIKVAWDVIVGIFTVAISLLTGKWGAAWTAMQTMATQVWNAIKAFFQTTWTAIQAIFSAAATFLQALLTAAWNLIRATVTAVWNAIAAFFGSWWATLRAAFAAALAAVEAALAAAWNSIRTTAATTWNAIWAFFVAWWNTLRAGWAADLAAVEAALSAGWTSIRTTAASIWNAIWAFFTSWWATLRAGWAADISAVEAALAAAWNSIYSTVQSVWNTIRGWFDQWWAGLQQGFRNAVAGVQAVWNTIQEIARAPVAFIVNTVYDKGIVPVVNAVGSLIGLHLSAINFASGGRVTQGTGPTSDDVLARVSRGETVVSAAHSQALAPIFSAVGVPGYAAGGIPFGGVLGDILGAVSSVVNPSSAPANIGGLLNLTGDALAAAASAILNPLLAGVPTFGTALGAGLKKIPATIIEKLVALMKATSSGGGDIVADAKSWIGKIPYVWGGRTLGPAGADCSGFTQAIYARHGINAPGTSETQGAWVKRGSPTAGGLAFYHSPAGGPDPGHVAIVADAASVVSQGGGMGPQMMALHGMPLLWTGIPPGGLPQSSTGSAGAAGSAAAGSVKALAQQQAAALGWTGALWNDINALEMREAGWSLTATNPTSGAYGIAQFINGASEYAQYGGNSGSAAGQITAFYNYIAQRYGGPAAAWAHEQQFGWYGNGGSILEPVAGVGLHTGAGYMFGESGPETVTPGLSGGGGLDRIAGLLEQLIGTTAAVPEATGHHVGGALSGAASSAGFRSRYPQGGW